LSHISDPQTIGYWTSGNDLAVEGTWVWGYPEGIPMTTTDWFRGEPNNHWYDGRLVQTFQNVFLIKDYTAILSVVLNDL
jgi:hypothetical protein